MVTITEPHPKRAPRLRSGKGGDGREVNERAKRGERGEKTQSCSLWHRSNQIACNKAVQQTNMRLSLLMIWFDFSLLLYVATFPSVPFLFSTSPFTLLHLYFVATTSVQLTGQQPTNLRCCPIKSWRSVNNNTTRDNKRGLVKSCANRSWLNIWSLSLSVFSSCPFSLLCLSPGISGIR